MRDTRGRELALFVPDIVDSCTIKRTEGFLGHGYALTVFGFRRDRYNRDYRPTWPHIQLGRTQDTRYLQRLGAMLAALPTLMAHRRRLRQAAIYYARNIDQLLLALFARAISGSRARVVYEVLDIQPAFVGQGPFSRLLRTVERFCLRRVALLVLSSPGFLRHYYGPVQFYRKPWFLLENKLSEPVLLPSERRKLPVGRPQGDRQGYRWVVGYNGLIRGHGTLDLIAQLAERLRGEVLFKFRGIFTTVDRDYFAEIRKRNPNIVYEGEYVVPNDLQRIYAEIDFVWALDLENVSDNSRWLLPCRFYEAGFFGVPCLAARNFEVGGLIDRLGVGWTFDEPLPDSIEAFLRGVSEAALAEKRRRLLDLPMSHFVAGDDIAALCSLMEGDRERPGPRPSLGVATL